MGVQGMRRLLSGILAVAFAVIGTPLNYPVPPSAHQVLCSSLLGNLRVTSAEQQCGFCTVWPGQDAASVEALLRRPGEPGCRKADHSELGRPKPAQQGVSARYRRGR